jgi:hypothetical protein
MLREEKQQPILPLLEFNTTPKLNLRNDLDQTLALAVAPPYRLIL